MILGSFCTEDRNSTRISKWSCGSESLRDVAHFPEGMIEVAEKITRMDVFSRDKANTRPQERSSQSDLQLRTHHTSVGPSPRSQRENPLLISKSRYGAVDIVAGFFLLTYGRELDTLMLTRVKKLVAGGYY